MSTNTLNQPTNQPTNAATLHYLAGREPTIGDLFRMRGHAADTMGGLDTLADIFVENFQWGMSTGHEGMARQAAFDLECVRLIRGARK